MFTGLIEEVGECLWLRHATNSIQFALTAPGMSRQIRAGESVAVNGACLTVASQSQEHLEFDLLQETLLRTNFGDLRPASKVNLERAVQADGRLGGHFVQGHVDCTGTVLACEEDAGDLKIEFQLPWEFSRYVVMKRFHLRQRSEPHCGQAYGKVVLGLDHSAHQKANQPGGSC